jgi:alpha-2-macroglobulin
MFEAAFTPKADERRARPGSGLTYRYVLSVDVTDEGGETRSASRSFRLGFVSVEARIEADRGFLPVRVASAFKVTLADLDGAPKRGRGTWRVVRLLGPEATPLPADQPLPEPPRTRREKRSVSKLRATASARVGDPGLGPEEILRLWKDGAQAAKGAVEHDIRGQAAVTVPPLEPGAYRLIYETKDDFGAPAARAGSSGRGRNGSSRRFGPAAARPLGRTGERDGRKDRPVPRPRRLAGQPLLLETFKGGEVLERRWLEAGKDEGIWEVPVTEDHRGGFSVQVTALRDHQAMTSQADVFVPWDNKELDISFSSFRDKLAPGGRETWRVTVKTPGGQSPPSRAPPSSWPTCTTGAWTSSLPIGRPVSGGCTPPGQGRLPVATSRWAWRPRPITEDSEWVKIPSAPGVQRR